MTTYTTEKQMPKMLKTPKAGKDPPGDQKIMVALVKPDTETRIGKFILSSSDSNQRGNQSDSRWNQRTEALARWLVQQWRLEQAQTKKGN
ncbi:MAG: hypothetical protein K8S55_07645 [Phycisphaerae bacterium]|nr:hypothetical protein [Phycisphaerae bacterium]